MIMASDVRISSTLARPVGRSERAGRTWKFGSERASPILLQNRRSRPPKKTSILSTSSTTLTSTPVSSAH